MTSESKGGNKEFLHADVVNDLERRQNEYRQKYGNKSHIVQIGNRTTREGDLKWEEEQRSKNKLIDS